jgi:MFS family permease
MPLPVNQLSGVGSSGSGLANRNAGGRSLQQEDSTNPGRSGSYNNLMGANENSSFVSSSKIASAGTGGGGYPGTRSGSRPKNGFKVYWRRWLMLFYMSLLNLLSDWTCYSVAPIALLTEEAFGSVDPERLVVVFLGANAIASACEPIILARLGLRKTVLFGALLLMIGSLVKSGGIPPIIPTDLVIGQEGWRLYLGFFLVGLSQPLYQCTPALLSASWFPEKERTMATGVALNANQLGIGFAFIFGTLLVSKPEDIPNYFGLLTLVSTIAFLGTLIQFDDAPPTPPSASARVMRGSIEINLPSIDSIVQSVRGMGGPERPSAPIRTTPGIVPSPIVPPPSPAESRQVDTDNKRRSKTDKTRKRSGTRKRGKGSSSNIVAPSPALSERTSEVISHIDVMKSEARMYASAPSPAMSGRVGGDGDSNNDNDTSEESGLNSPPHMGEAEIHPRYEGGFPPPGGAYPSPYGAFPPYQYPPYWDPLVQQQIQEQHAAAYQQQLYYFQQQQHASHQTPPPYYYHDPYPSQLPRHDWQHTTLPAADAMDEGAEPTIIMTPNHLDIDIRDDQVLLSIRACLSRPGFLHALVAFTVSGIVINTLSTYMDYLVGLNGAPRYYTGVVGGTFQFLIMISSLIIGKQTDKTRAYYSVTIGMLVLGAFGLAECGVSLDENNGRDLRWSLLIVAVLVGPLQPVSTELGVDVAYPLSENTVLVIQQLFSNLLSALFIPVFKALKNVGTTSDEMDERPEYTFSFYLLIVLHTGATIFFATFNGRYLRYEHEVQKKAEDEREKFQSMLESGEPQAFHPFYADHQGNFNLSFDDERRPLVS